MVGQVERTLSDFVKKTEANQKEREKTIMAYFSKKIEELEEENRNLQIKIEFFKNLQREKKDMSQGEGADVGELRKLKKEKNKRKRANRNCKQLGGLTEKSIQSFFDEVKNEAKQSLKESTEFFNKRVFALSSGYEEIRDQMTIFEKILEDSISHGLSKSENSQNGYSQATEISRANEAKKKGTNQTKPLVSKRKLAGKDEKPSLKQQSLTQLGFFKKAIPFQPVKENNQRNLGSFIPLSHLNQSHLKSKRKTGRSLEKQENIFESSNLANNFQRKLALTL